MARRFELGLLLLAACPAIGFAQSLKIEPSLASSLGYTDNATLGRERQSDWTLDVRPRVSLTAQGGRLQGRLDYAFDGVLHSRSGVGARHYNTLSADGTLEAIEGFLFVDARASVAGENLSAFAPQALDNASASDNRREVRSFSLSPYLRGRLGSLANYSVRVDWNTLDARAAAFARTSNQRINATLASAEEGKRLNWSLSADSNVNHYRDRGDLRNEVVRARLGYSPAPGANIFATLGREGYNYVAGESSRSMQGYGVSWSGVRTQVSAERENRFFGSYYAAKFSHRLPRAAFSVDFSRDLSSSTQQVFTAGDGNVLGVLFDLYATRVPDPLTRLKAVLDFLNQSGIPPFLGQPFAFFAEQPFVNRRLQATAVVTGARNNVAVSAYNALREAQGIGFPLIDDFAVGRRIESRGASLVWSHSITPLANLNLNLAQSRSRALDTGQSNRSRQLGLTLQTPLSARTNAFANLRHNRGDGTSDFRENAIVGGVRIDF